MEKHGWKSSLLGHQTPELLATPICSSSFRRQELLRTYSDVWYIAAVRQDGNGVFCKTTLHRMLIGRERLRERLRTPTSRSIKYI